MPQDVAEKKPAADQGPADAPPRRPLSMHEDVPLWCDCCSCEAEPRWQAVEEDLQRERREGAGQGRAFDGGS